MKLEFYPDFDLKVVEVDNNLESKVCNDGVLVAFTGEENGVFFPYESDTNSLTQPIIGVFEDEMMPLVRYIVEKYKKKRGFALNFIPFPQKEVSFLFL